jgi:hypothetical protein
MPVVWRLGRFKTKTWSGSALRVLTRGRPSMMPKSVKRFSGDIMLYLFDLEPDSDFRSNRPEIIRL